MINIYYLQKSWLLGFTDTQESCESEYLFSFMRHVTSTDVFCVVSHNPCSQSPHSMASPLVYISALDPTQQQPLRRYRLHYVSTCTNSHALWLYSKTILKGVNLLPSFPNKHKTSTCTLKYVAE